MGRAPANERTAYAAATTEIAERPRSSSQVFAARTRKKNSDSTLLYGAVRTDAVITAKTKKLASKVFWLSYKDGNEGQY